MFLCPRSSAANQKNPLLHFSFTIVTLAFLIFFFFTKPTFCLTERSLEAYSSIPAAKFQLKNFGSSLLACSIIDPYLRIDVSIEGPLRDEENITVTVSGVLVPSDLMWVGLVSPPDVDVSPCPLNAFMYEQTGDLSSLPLLCHYPVKAQYLSKDPSFLNCEKEVCQRSLGEACALKTCNASITFHVVNIRTDIGFVLFHGGFDAPCVLKRSNTLRFDNPLMPLYPHLSSLDSTSTSMRVTWVSGDDTPQQVKYGNGMSATSTVTTFTKDDLCSGNLQSPAKGFGWHDPGYIHSAVMTGLEPLHSYSYRYGSNSAGWSTETEFHTPPAGGSNHDLVFIAFGDMGRAPLDLSVEHYMQAGSLSVVATIADEIASGRVDSVFHIGDISYATGFLVVWDYFLQLITPIASHVPYMTAIGNHEKDYVNSNSVYITPDSGGECGVAYETYFQMPMTKKDEPWYSIEQAGVHFTVISTEHSWIQGSDQYKWIKKDLASVNRTRTPWLILTGHRPMYSSAAPAVIPSVDYLFTAAVETLLMQYQVDLVLFGHVHSYERTCALYEDVCVAMPSKDSNGVDTYDQSNYTAPVHAIIGMAGFTLSNFSDDPPIWSLVRISEFGYVRFNATRKQLKAEFVNSSTRIVRDSFKLIKN
ncbi:probable inactive purple acid phosphatase 1 [Nymphaea colorata]|nr:probable inactive purple acid phosphatase 1 [Nymphaea colorata]